jgi:hypothetical protein
MHDELERSRQNKQAQELHIREDKERQDDMNVIFGEKKKW